MARMGYCGKLVRAGPQADRKPGQAASGCWACCSSRFAAGPSIEGHEWWLAISRHCTILEDGSGSRFMGGPPDLAKPPLIRRHSTVSRLTVPRTGQALRLLSVGYAACEGGDHAALEALLALGRTQAFRHRFTFLMLGLHERDPLRSPVRGIPRFTFSSQAFATSLGDIAGLEKRVAGIRLKTMR